MTATTYDLDVYREAIERATSVEDVRAIRLALAAELEGSWRGWLAYLYPEYVKHGFAVHHKQFWDAVWSVRAGESADPLIAGWPRGGAKSTSVELAVVALAAKGERLYCLYVSGTQRKANDHVGNVAAMLEGDRFADLYPGHADRLLTKWGQSRGWRADRVRTSGGFTVDAVGLDSDVRGAKLDQARPDLIVFDDIDQEHDSAETTLKKIETLTRAILPAQAEHSVTFGVQNLIIPNGVFARLLGVSAEPADFLVRRKVMGGGPIPAVRDLVLDHDQRDDHSAVIVAGEPTWEGLSLDRCQALIDEYGETAFLIECQHEVGLRGGGMFDHLTFLHCTPEDVPDLTMTTVWVDPAVTDTDRSDAMGIQADGLAADGTIYRLRSWEQRSSPETALTLAISWGFELGARVVGVETDQGGDTWRSVFNAAMETVLAERPEWRDKPRPNFASEKAGAGNGPKTERAARMLADYERSGRTIVHVIGSSSTVLESSLNRFPRSKPFDLVDAAFWSWRYLRTQGQRARTNRNALLNGNRAGALR